MGLAINGVEVTKIEIGSVEVLKIEDANGNVLYNAAPPATVSVTLTYNGYDFSWTTSDGRSGSMTSGDPDYTLTIADGQTVTFATGGSEHNRITLNDEDQCYISSGEYTYTYGYSDLADNDVISCTYFREPC